jgi:signal peptidase II
LKKFWQKYALLIIVTAVIIVIDQATKLWITNNLALGETYCFIDGICEQVRFIHWYNTGIAFGLFQGNSILFSVTSIIIVVIIFVFYNQIPQQEWLLRLALAFEVGGALGNFIDRVTLGHVTDFVAVGRFPIFNVADASINIGVALMFLSILLEEIKDRRKKKAAELPSDESAPEISQEHEPEPDVE